MQSFCVLPVTMFLLYKTFGVYGVHVCLQAPQPPCWNGGTCYDLLYGDWGCQCDSQHMGDRCETDIRICAQGKHECHNQGECYGTPPDQQVYGDDITYSCKCQAGWTGRFCNFSKAAFRCKQHRTCNDNGEGVLNKKGCVCECFKGYSGDDCQFQDDICEPNPCPNGGACYSRSMSGGYGCTCLQMVDPKHKFAGDHCEKVVLEKKVVDDVTKETVTVCDPCKTLVWDDEECSPGYDNLYKNTINKLAKPDSVVPTVCGPHGNCSYQEVKIEKENNKSVVYFQCFCDLGYFGEFCENKTADWPCMLSPNEESESVDRRRCKNDAGCQTKGKALLATDFTCTCKPGWSGDLCEEYDPCADVNQLKLNYEYRCRDGESCVPVKSSVQTKSDFICLCDPSKKKYRHMKCLLAGPKCVDQYQCGNGNCIDCKHFSQSSADPTDSPLICDSKEELQRGYMCVCQPDWAGLNCNEPYTACTTNPCKNNGICKIDLTDIANKYECICDEFSGWGGENCDELDNICIVHNPCAHGSTCVKDLTVTRGFKCQCPPNREGLKCDQPADTRIDWYFWAPFAFYSIISIQFILYVMLLIFTYAYDKRLFKKLNKLT